MSDSLTYDLVVLGGGTGGYAAALRAAELDMKVALIERDKVGGTCLHRGCVPTKALLHTAEVADSAKESETFGVDAEFKGIDIDKVLEYKTNVINRNYKGLQGLIKARGIDTYLGDGKLVGQDKVEVKGADETYTLTGKNILLSTGSTSKTLGLDVTDRVLTSTEALELKTVPKSVIVLGGGVIGVEFASVWKSYGADVTIVEGLPHLVANEDESISKALERAFKKRKINYKLGVMFKGVEETADGVKVTLEDGTVLEAEYLLVAVGRGPVTEASATKSRVSRWTADSSSPMSACTPASATSTPSATSSPASSSPTARSVRASSSPRRSPGWDLCRSSKAASPA